MGERALIYNRIPWACAAVAMLSARAAVGAPGPWAALPESLEIAIDDCSPAAIGGGAVEALSTELQSDGVRCSATEDPVGAAGQLSILILCGASTDSKVVLTRLSTGKTATATLGLDDVPKDLRPRALALATSELVRGYWSVLIDHDANVDLNDHNLKNAAQSPSVSVFPDIPVSAPPTLVFPALSPTPPKNAGGRDAISVSLARPRDSANNPRKSWVGLDTKVRAFLNQPTLYLGGGIDRGVGRWTLGVEGLASQKEDTLGTVSSGLVSLRVGYNFELAADELWAWRIGPRGGIGVAWASGTDALSGRGRDAVGMYADFAARTEAQVRTAPVQAVLSLEGGVARGLAALAGDRTVSTSGGWFFGSGLGIRYETLGGL